MISNIFRINNFKKIIVGGATVITYKSYLDSLNDKENQKSLTEAQNNATNEINKKLEGVIEENTKNKLTALKLQIDENKFNIKKEINSLNKTSPENKTSFEYHQIELDKHFKKGDDLWNELKNTIDKSKSKFIDNDDLIDSYKEFISELDSEQLCNLMSISTSLFILICLYDILIINFGNEIIDYFKLDLKFPKIAKIINLRKKVTRFSIFINYLLIFLAVIFIIYINCITMIYK